ncbi:hypothetical protein GCM10027056_15080 [Glaciibacter psychrotolerans]
MRKGAHNELLDGLESDYELESALFDHARHFRKSESGTTAAIVTAPYLRATIGYFGSAAKANERISEIARALGLNVRVGHPEDTIYLSNLEGDPTLPIVWWNPDRYSLELPEVEDPNPRFAHRMSTF